MMVYQFSPRDDLTAGQLAEVFVALQVRVDEGTFINFPESVQQQFRQLSEDELGELARQRKAQIEAMRLAADVNRKGRIIVPDVEDVRVITP